MTKDECPVIMNNKYKVYRKEVHLGFRCYKQVWSERCKCGNGAAPHREYKRLCGRFLASGNLLQFFNFIRQYVKVMIGIKATGKASREPADGASRYVTVVVTSPMNSLADCVYWIQVYFRPKRNPALRKVRQ